MVLDTNTVLSAVLFARGRLAWIRAAWQARRFVPLVSRATTDELVRALTYPKFELERPEIEALLGLYLPYAEVVDVSQDWPNDLPHCDDENDDMFLLLAARGAASVLVTGDRALLSLDGHAPFAIESPARFRRRWAPDEE